MRRENLHEPYSIHFQTLTEGFQTDHTHSFFELVYVLEGSGKQCINQSVFNYRADHLFLITPEDCHSFEVHTASRFFFLRFNNIYIQESGISTGNIRNLEFILKNANHKPDRILKSVIDKKFTRPLVEAIIREREQPDLYNQELIPHYLNTFIVLVARNIAKFQQLEMGEQTDERVHSILHFIQANIYSPEKLRAEYISDHFNVSVNYIGKYFKHHTGSTLQKYVMQYRQTLVEHRLRYSDKRLSEIVDEFGFTDESHLNKFFRNNKGISPKQFRKDYASLLAT